MTARGLSMKEGSFLTGIFEKYPRPPEADFQEAGLEKLLFILCQRYT